MSINDIPLQRLKDILASDMPLTIVTTEALIARLEQAEQERKNFSDACKTLAQVLAKHSDWVVEATDSQDIIGEDGDGDWDVVWDRVTELGESKRKAEAAVARVREFKRSLTPLGKEVVVAAQVKESIDRALDGEPNEV